MHVVLGGTLMYIFTMEPELIFAVRKQLYLESIEGNKGQPRLKPPFPALVGLIWLSNYS